MSAVCPGVGDKTAVDGDSSKNFAASNRLSVALKKSSKVLNSVLSKEKCLTVGKQWLRCLSTINGQDFI